MNFQQELKKLNKRQQEAVQAIEGPVMVVAGPGTGKTQILTLRIANILKQAQVEPENILAITFTESGVAAMRKRLAQLIGSEAYSVAITTFHAFCNNIIREHPESFPHIIGATPMTEVDQLQVLERVITKSSLKLLRPFGEPLFYIKDIVWAIDDLKRENILPADFQKIAKAELKEAENDPDAYHTKGKFKGQLKGDAAKAIKRAQKNVELSQVYGEYQSALTKQKRYDYTDMIIEAVRALTSDKELLFELQEAYQYVLVDEHQDTNNAQNKLLELLMSFHKNPNLFVVGDVKQAIYRFQGASLENFLYFKKLYPKAKLIELAENYRSTQHILDAAADVTRVDKTPLSAQSKSPKRKILKAELSGALAEQYFVARHISERIKAGADSHEVAILYRNNKDALGIATMLERLEVPFTIESAQNIFDDPDIKKLRMLLTAVAKFGNHEFLALLLYTDFLKIDALDAHKVIAFARNSKINIYDVIKSGVLLKQVGVVHSEIFLQLYENLSRWRSAAQYHSAAEVFESAVSESGFLAHILSKQNSADTLHKLNVFFDELKDLTDQRIGPGSSPGRLAFTLGDFVAYLDMLDEHDLLIKRAPAAHRQVGRVRLMTAHASKGQEFDYVYIMGASDGHWGNRRKVEMLKVRSAPDDDRNLFYVALTRARKEVVISYAKMSASGREQLPSEFVVDIRPELIEPVATEAYEKDFANTVPHFAKASRGASAKISEREFIRELFISRGLSVTHLNNYLECPWRYFFVSLLRIPEAKNKHLMYGTAVHAALKELFDAKEKNKQILLKAFQSALSQEPMNKDEYAEALEKGKKALAGYYDEYSKTWTKEVLSEFSIAGVEMSIEPIDSIRAIRLTGALDKMEILNSKNEVNVVDYKTGKPKSLAMLTKGGADGNYYRQLVFYKLLLQLYKNGLYVMKTGEIDFIEPDERGKYHKEQFAISDKEVSDLKKEIERVSSEIINLKFWNQTCADKTCKYCALRAFMA